MSTNRDFPAWQNRETLQTFIENESALLDANNLRSWVKLFSDEGHYHMPVSMQFSDPRKHDSLMYENRTLMEVRARNFTHPVSPSMERGVRSVRVLSNHRVLSSDETTCTLRCNFMAMVYWVKQEVYGGFFTYDLAIQGEDIRIGRKRVADTTAAICGQLAGAFNGASSIPSHWLERLAMRTEIVAIADQLLLKRVN